MSDLDYFLKNINENFIDFFSKNYSENESNRVNLLLDSFKTIIDDNKEYIFINSEKIKTSLNFKCYNLENKKIKDCERFKRSIISILNSSLFEYETRKISKNLCNCIIRKKYSIEPDLNFVKFIEKEFDGYYLNEIYICNNCKTNWILEEIEDEFTNKRWK